MNVFIIRILNKLNLLNYLNLSNVRIKLNNTIFKIPILKKIGLSNLFMTEPWMIQVLNIVLPIKNGVFIDVGVNIGQTLIKLKSSFPETRYIGFEPNPECINYLNKLVKENDFNNISIIPVGISDETKIGVLNFFNSSSVDPSASIINKYRPDSKIDRVEYVPLFDLKKIKEFITIKNISILKIDVEGAELEVLNSFYSLISEQNPIILIEILPVYVKENHFRVKRQNKIQNLLTKLDYSIYRVIKENDILLDLEEISNIEVHSDLNMCEYVMVPNVNKKQLLTNFKQKQ